MGRLNSSREAKFSGTYGDRGIFIFPAQPTRAGLATLTGWSIPGTLLYVMTIHTYIHYRSFILAMVRSSGFGSVVGDIMPYSGSFSLPLILLHKKLNSFKKKVRLTQNIVIKQHPRSPRKRPKNTDTIEPKTGRKSIFTSEASYLSTTMQKWVHKNRPPSPTAAQLQNIYELLIRQKNRDPHTEQNTPRSEASY